MRRLGLDIVRHLEYLLGCDLRRLLSLDVDTPRQMVTISRTQCEKKMLVGAGQLVSLSYLQGPPPLTMQPRAAPPTDPGRQTPPPSPKAESRISRTAKRVLKSGTSDPSDCDWNRICQNLLSQSVLLEALQPLTGYPLPLEARANFTPHLSQTHGTAIGSAGTQPRQATDPCQQRRVKSTHCMTASCPKSMELFRHYSQVPGALGLFRFLATSI